MASDSYSDKVSYWKKSSKKPIGLHENVWKELQVHWAKPETIADAKTHSDNRKKNPNGTHNSGATSFRAREVEIASKNGGVFPTYEELIEVTHTNKKTGKIDLPIIAGTLERVKKIKEDRLTQLTQSEGCDNVEISREEINQIVLSEIPLKKGRRTGLGKIVSNDSSTSYAFPRDPELIKEVETLKTALGEKDVEMSEFRKQYELQNVELSRLKKVQALKDVEMSALKQQHEQTQTTLFKVLNCVKSKYPEDFV